MHDRSRKRLDRGRRLYCRLLRYRIAPGDYVRLEAAAIRAIERGLWKSPKAARKGIMFSILREWCRQDGMRDQHTGWYRWLTKTGWSLDRLFATKRARVA